ncbi:MAG: helix-turn-helix domain-containing protein [Flavobacteriaceae bacterium]
MSVGIDVYLFTNPNKMKLTIAIDPDDKSELKEFIAEIIREEILNYFASSPLQKEFLTPEETAEMLSLKVGTIYNWNSNGKLRPYQLLNSNKVYFKRSDIMELIQK